MARSAKRATKVRTESEFKKALALPAAVQPAMASPVFSWELEAIYQARQDQQRGHFWRPKQLADAMGSDDAVLVARTNRLAPIECLDCRITPRNSSAKARSIANEAEALFGVDGIGVTQPTLTNIHACFVEHGLAVGVVDKVAREDGSRVDLYLRYWPIEFVRWDSVARQLVTRIDSSDTYETPITHGDGTWAVFSRAESEPWMFGVLRASSLVWARHAFGNRDWLAGSKSHGNAKVVGELAAGVPLQSNDGSLSPEAAAFIELLAGIAGESTAGIRPAGSKTEYLTNTSNAWQVWSELINGAEKSAARIYLGTDGVLGSQGGAPGIDIESLFGVSTTIVQSDIRVIERGLREGIIEPWCAINFGDTTLCPSRDYVIPDGDSDAEAEAYATRRQAYFADVTQMRALGFEVTQEVLGDLAKRYNVETPKLLPLAAEVTP